MISDELYDYSFEYIEQQFSKQIEKWKDDPTLTVYNVPDEDLPEFAKLISSDQLARIKRNVSEESYQHMIDLIEKYK